MAEDVVRRASAKPISVVPQTAAVRTASAVGAQMATIMLAESQFR
jgi:hypothetical protein